MLSHMLEMYTFPTIAKGIITLGWYRWPEIQGLVHGLWQE